MAVAEVLTVVSAVATVRAAAARAARAMTTRMAGTAAATLAGTYSIQQSVKSSGAVVAATTAMMQGGCNDSARPAQVEQGQCNDGVTTKDKGNKEEGTWLGKGAHQ